MKRYAALYWDIETRSEDGVHALVARANNPRENFIRNVRKENFVISSLKEVVATAKRLRDERIKADPKLTSQEKSSCVAIPFDRASQSSSNRGAVVEVYRACFSGAPVIGLVNEEETNFNDYKIWDKNGAHKCVKIWEIDEHGKETWYGQWDLG